MANTILVCEDNEVNVVLLRDILAVDGYEILEAADGRTGVSLAEETEPDLIIMDIQMPLMNGYDAMRALRENPATRKIPILAITSFAMVGDRERAMKAGADEYISKPIDTRNIRGLVRRMLRLEGG
ncbi:MAG TPA: response regulator [Rectinemataceae bacterium]|nr:response regulator [Rectinemataceae bacterium]